jgi:4-diphosphocytidyl-2-C-methyl-D-erythritol kinase
MNKPPPTAPAGETRLVAPCKINLHLRILSRRPDGYHDLETLFLALPHPADELVIRPLPGDGGLRLACSDPALDGPDNLVARAYRAYGEKTGFFPALDVFLDKRIPAGSGLGGASSDAARMLAQLNDRAPHPVSARELSDMGAGLGADVPFFLQDGPALARGIGEKLSPFPLDLSGFALVLVCPGERVNTAWAYRAYDEQSENEAPALESLLTSAFQRNIRPFCVTGLPLFNSFERVVFAARPGLRRLKETLFSLGAAGAALSGSGSAMFGLFRDREKARQAAAGLVRQGVDGRLVLP